jgi:phytoene/squalene synthetase
VAVKIFGPDLAELRRVGEQVQVLARAIPGFENSRLDAQADIPQLRIETDRERAAAYAETLGRALQYTNILRDTRSDLARGRVYYPLDELSAAGVESFPHDAQDHLRFFAEKTDTLFDEVATLSPSEDLRALRPARIMATIYRSLLRKMRHDGLRVTEKRYRLSAPEKLLAIARALSQ